MHEVFVGESALSVAGGSPRKYQEAFVRGIAVATGRPFILAGDMSPEGRSTDPVIAAMAAIRGLAVVILGIAEDARRAAGATVPKRLTSAADACQGVIAEDARVIAGAGGTGTAPASPPAIVRSVLNAVASLGGACNRMRSVFAGPQTGDTDA